MELTAAVIAENAAEYRAEEPLYTVEAEHLEMLPDTLADGEYGWRDVEWIVQWYFRRHLGAYPDGDRRRAESAFRDNDFDDVLDTVDRARLANTITETVEILTSLDGVDTGVASAFCFFLDPDTAIAIGHREWRALCVGGEIERDYPDTLSAAAYQHYLSTCHDLATRFDCDLWTLYRGLWRIGADETSFD